MCLAGWRHTWTLMQLRGRRRWDGQELSNGELLRAAEDGGFDLLLTCDRNLEYQQTVTGRKIAIVALSTNNWPLIRMRAADVAVAVDGAMPGMYRTVECGVFRRQ